MNDPTMPPRKDRRGVAAWGWATFVPRPPVRHGFVIDRRVDDWTDGTTVVVIASYCKQDTSSCSYSG